MGWMLQCPRASCAHVEDVPEKSGRLRCPKCDCLIEFTMLEDTPEGWQRFYAARRAAVFADAKQPRATTPALLVWRDAAQKDSIPPHGLAPDRKKF